MSDREEFGVVGLGKMGGNLALQALEKGLCVAGYTRGEPSSELLEQGLVNLEGHSGFRKELKAPRVVFIYVPAGPVVDTVLDQLSDELEEGDILVDGGNSYWGDSIRRHERLREKGLRFVDCGTSGGTSGARNGACFMVGGDEEAIRRVEPILTTLAVEGGYVHAGSAGSGHFVKLVHNGIEFGMLQAIGEGMNLLEEYRESLDIEEVLHCWNNGSVIRSWLIELMGEAYRQEEGLEKIPAFVEDTGEVNWLVDDAMKMEVSTPVIAQSVMQLLASRDNKQHWARAIAMMRHGFGGHPYGSDEAIARERREGRVGQFYRH